MMIGFAICCLFLCLLAQQSFPPAHRAGTEWRVESFGFNAFANLPVAKIGIDIVNGQVADYTVRVTDQDGSFYVWARNPDHDLVSAFVTAMWDKSGADAYKAIDRFHFRVPADDFTEALSDRSYKVTDGRGPNVHIDAYTSEDTPGLILNTPHDNTVYGTLGNDLIFTGSGNDTVVLRGGRSFVSLGKGNDVVEDRINENLQYTPKPDHSPQIDDVFVGAADGEYSNPWQSLLKAYASDFVNADTVKYSAAYEPKRLPSGWEKTAGAALFDLINPLYKKKGVEVTAIRPTDYLQDFAKAHKDEFGFLTQSPLEISLINLSNGEAQTDMLVGFERVMLTEGADKVDVSDDMVKQVAIDNQPHLRAAA